MNTQELFDFYCKLDRSIFLDGEYKEYAKIDRALPIGFGQTISQPSLVFEMTVQLDLDMNCRVLEIGTGSGYQTALLAQFSKAVYSVERVEDLSLKAQERLAQLGFNNIKFKVGVDGSKGWVEYAPFDRIIVTAGAGKIPQDLTEQLKRGGKMIIPVGEKEKQELLILNKDAQGMLSQKSLGAVKFVPLVGKYSY